MKLSDPGHASNGETRNPRQIDNICRGLRAAPKLCLVHDLDTATRQSDGARALVAFQEPTDDLSRRSKLCGDVLMTHRNHAIRIGVPYEERSKPALDAAERDILEECGHVNQRASSW